VTVSLRIIEHLHVATRGATLEFPGSGRISTFGGGIAVEPWVAATAPHASSGRLRLWLAVDRMTSKGDAMPVVGAPSGDSTIVMLVASAIAPFAID
jgi:hypothetical protein